MNKLHIVIGGLALTITLHAQAANQGWYFGGSLGQVDYGSMKQELNFLLSSVPPDSAVVDAVVTVAPAAADSFDVDDSDIGWGATVGYRFLDYLAVELSYLDLGTLHTSETLSLPFIPPETLQVNQELRTTGAAISVLGIVPLRDRWDVFVRVGLLVADQELTVSSSGSSLIPSFRFANDSDRSNTALLGAGVQYNWANWSARLELQRCMDMELADVDLLGLGVFYRLN